VTLRRCVALLAGALAALLLAAGGSDKPTPTPLKAYSANIAGRQVWAAKVDGVAFPLSVVARDGRFIVASNDGTLVGLDAGTGRELWRASAGGPLSAGVGSDGRFHAVVTRDNVLVAFDGTREVWRERLKARVTTAPFVAGERVFVTSIDRAVAAYDALDGKRLWEMQRQGDALTLLHGGVLTAVRNTLVVGQGSRMAGVDPLRGTLRWEVPVSNPRGTNEVERLADLIGPVTRLGDTLCVRAFQSSVGCVDAVRGSLLWSRHAGGINAIGGDDKLLFGADGSDRIFAWSTANGELAWTNESLLFRGLSAPAMVGPTVVFGDFEGIVHVLDRSDGQTLLRLPTDGSPVVGKPTLSDTTLLVVTRKGGLFAFRPE
jgi:outer membrane assembly lipoprotein YfgL